MADSKKILNNFYNFVSNNGVQNFSKLEIRLLNMIINNIDDISVVGTAAGKRGKLLNTLLLRDWNDLSEEILIDENQYGTIEFPVKKLHSIQINNFRGFSTPFSYDFAKPYTLIYGTNGSGKTSFCEALEYSMLGYISEAESKRIQTSKYITNISTGRSTPPILKAIDNEDKEIFLIPSPNTYHFSFIEKNRIDGFARISANTPSDKSKLLSTLLGLEEFSHFVSEFTDNIEKYIDIEGERAKVLISKRHEIEKYHHTIGNAEINISNLKKEKDALIHDSELKMTFEEINTYVHGNNETAGRLKQVDTELNNINTSHYETNSLVLLVKGSQELYSLIQDYKSQKEELEKSKDGVNYRKLYSAVKELEYISSDKCPVCLTPLENVTMNPYRNANQGLDILKRLAILEEDVENKNEKIIEGTKEIIKDIRIKNKFAKELGSPFELILSDELNEITKKTLDKILKDIESFISDIKRNMDSLTLLDSMLNYKNEEYRKSSDLKRTLILEKEHLQKISVRIKDIETKEKVFGESIITAKQKISDFELVNELLLKEVEEEKKQIVKNIEFVSSYKSLIDKLKRYDKEMPTRMISDLNDLVRDFYNEINKHDSTFEQLYKIDLPTKSQDMIIAYFKDNPSKPVDALQVLSEGHVRCLGLAILLAKIVKDNIGVIIFDDVVNAIDDDHRGGIRELLLGNEMLNTRQIILTSHAEEFIKDLENQVEKKQYKNYINRISFLPPENRNIRVDLQSSANYLSNAQSSLERSQKRECLRNCRSALENINSVLWKRLANKYNTSITVKIRQPKGMPDSMSTVTGLSEFLKKTVKDSKYDKIVEIYEYLRGLETINNSVWNYLNKGTHEEEGLPEFDLLIVQELFSKLEILDSEAKAV